MEEKDHIVEPNKKVPEQDYSLPNLIRMFAKIMIFSLEAFEEEEKKKKPK